LNVFVVDGPVGTEAEGAIQSGFIGRSPLIAFGITEIRLAALGHARTVSLAVARFADAWRSSERMTTSPPCRIAWTKVARRDLASRCCGQHHDAVTGHDPDESPPGLMERVIAVALLGPGFGYLLKWRKTRGR
jgi:hypothetical protein